MSLNLSFARDGVAPPPHRVSVSARRLACRTVCAAGLFACAIGHAATWEVPFSAQSPWNARPTGFVLAPDIVPKSDYYPNIAEGDYSVRVFKASETDPPVTVMALPDKPGLYIADAEEMVPQIVIPHWPAGVAPAAGGDGHADIVDVAANRIHSFYQLRLDNGQWRAAQYTWSALDGRGWGDPGHYFQGSRAAGVPTMAGIIRTVELADGAPMFRHALAMSMTFNALAADPAYTYPATAADFTAAQTNSGVFPEGSLIMLPADYDTASIKSPIMQKIARTLQTYGAYLVDANYGTPFAIYVEIGSKFSLMEPGKWDGEIAAELDRMRAGLRRVSSVAEWVDADGARFTPPRNLNLLSMRGPWSPAEPGVLGAYETWEQAVVFPNVGRKVSQSNRTGRGMRPVNWALPEAGASYRLAVHATGGATMKVELVDADGRVLFDSGVVADGESITFKWPPSVAKPWLTVSSGPNGGGKVSATLNGVEGKP